jgi:nucleoid-associated protein YgaU
MTRPIAFSTPGSAGGGGGLLGDVQGGAMDMASMAPGGLVDFAPSLQKATLVLHEPPPGGDASQPMGGELDTIRFSFNPKDLSFTKGARWNRRDQPNATSSAPPTFGGASPATLSFEMFLDATDDMGDKVVGTVERLMKACVPTSHSMSGSPPTPSAPWVVFRWGGLQGFPAIVKSINGKFTLFTPDGIPVRATCTVQLEEISGEVTGQNPTSGAKTATDLHVLVDGDTLASVAYKHYGNAAMWRAIAEANDIDDPMRLPVGTALLVPALSGIRRG